MPRPIRIKVLQENGVAALQITIEGQVSVLDGADVESLIEQLALFRSAMKPVIASQMSRSHDYLLEVDPCWYAEPNAAFDGLVTFFRHGGYGWTGYAINKNSLAELRAELVDFIATPAVAVGLAH
jgi:hypothetical protein